ncbi:MAG: rod shape-determining protein RodA [Deltaproteobacteria bacterium RIFCSPLOWO2_12_FULL_40_28]|nr:MAG: rod shape-determining protein RodA [Deltaproteobacteria bacterium RIFCSPHIGHO2_02_FULL_40_28]OGQ19749.1 MAG: rod shape-determining protein RodA [Deltaproteobacteria bacterium RIFCSPHIGHO2_12_FULL_40_32]OGQ41026.1 MAG: rod shape-determining protein RodA [Deltaproteobacteria bacterium RIFCSPLOWO2_02_FULL_40_36]OGQ54142.1 MAG: rod shape-determining protein RodA [Deltaproteobacteria bacterium RIFCSPLOWO2_12_FULL_40_28]
MFDRRLVINFNWFLLLTVLALIVIGIFNLYSATSSFDLQAQNHYFKPQILYHAIGFILLIFITTIHYRYFKTLSYVLYGLSILLLILVLVVGRKIYGHQSWLSIGPISLQPTEIAKLGLIFGLARQLATADARFRAGLFDLLPSMGLFLLPTLLVNMQGDLGSSLFYGLIYATLIFARGVNLKIVVVLTGVFIIISVVAYLYFLSPYQKDRLHTFLNPEIDRKGSGYHMVQSKIAIGSGGLAGKGYLKGQAHKLKFIPERHTDFIFPVLAEEWGFIGSVSVLILFLMFFALILHVASHSPDTYGYYLCLGSLGLFFWHVVVNIGGVLGLMPITGVPLPFFSYGGSSLLTDWIAIALVLNVGMRRFMFT